MFSYQTGELLQKKKILRKIKNGTKTFIIRVIEKQED